MLDIASDTLQKTTGALGRFVRKQVDYFGCSPTFLTTWSTWRCVEDAQGLQLAEQAQRGWSSHRQLALDERAAQYREFERDVNDHGRLAAAVFDCQRSVSLAQIEQLFGAGHSVCGLMLDPRKKEQEPAFEVAVLTDPLQLAVIGVPLTLEPWRKREQWGRKALTMHQVQHDEQAPNSAISVEEWVNGLELVVQ